MSLFLLAGYGAACALVYTLCPGRHKWLVLLAASYGFYAVRSFMGLPFLLMTTVTTYAGALAVFHIGERVGKAITGRKTPLGREEKKRLRAGAKRRQRLCLLVVLSLNFAALAVCKYADDVRGWFGAQPLGLLLPLGISFYTFQSMGYLIDVYRGKVQPERNPLRFALFVSFFPQLIQGPIGRWGQLAAQLFEPHRPDAQRMERGAMTMLWGLFKKMVIADRCAACVSTVFSAEAGAYGGAVSLLGVLLYSLEQYCDFSGGIDLVAGIAQMMGIELSPNFKRPYFAVSLGDFWRRWHISLGSWMRDYVFYPFALSHPVTALSKAAKGLLGTAFARALPAVFGNVLVFLLVGVWHGATANYILWGLYNGVILACSALAEPRFKRFAAAHARLCASRGFHVVRVLRTFVIVNIGWFFDRCASAGRALSMLRGIVTDFRPAELTLPLMKAFGLPAQDVGVLLAATLLLFCVSLAQEKGFSPREAVLSRSLPLRWLIQIGAVLTLLIFGVYGSGFEESAFIYYQF